MSSNFKSTTTNRNTNGGQANGGREPSPGQAQCEGPEAVAVADGPTPEQVRDACRRMSRPTRFEVDLLNDWCKP